MVIETELVPSAETIAITRTKKKNARKIRRETNKQTNLFAEIYSSTTGSCVETALKRRSYT